METSDKEFGELPSVLKGNTSIMLSDTGNAPAKVIKEFRKKMNRKYGSLQQGDEVYFIGSYFFPLTTRGDKHDKRTN